MRLIRLKIVVLPAPFGPMMENTSPCSHLEADGIDRADAAETDGDIIGRKMLTAAAPTGRMISGAGNRCADSADRPGTNA